MRLTLAADPTYPHGWKVLDAETGAELFCRSAKLELSVRGPAVLTVETYVDVKDLPSSSVVDGVMPTEDLVASLKVIRDHIPHATSEAAASAIGSLISRIQGS